MIGEVEESEASMLVTKGKKKEKKLNRPGRKCGLLHILTDCVRLLHYHALPFMSG